MSKKISFLGALSSVSIGKKQIMGLTGLALCGFLVTHLLGNFLVLLGPDAFNNYAHTLISNPFIYVAEAGLVALFLSHLFMALKLTWENRQARPVKYYMKKSTGRGETFASKTMIYTGVITFIFVVLHLISFKYGTEYTTYIDGVKVRDIYKLVIEYFSNPLYVAWYVVAMISMGIHTSHGFWSAFQSLGFNHEKYTPIIRKISCLYACFIGLGFSFLSIWCHFQN